MLAVIQICALLHHSVDITTLKIDARKLEDDPWWISLINEISDN